MSRAYVAIPIERIGTCEYCGATDHHLVEGLCPICRPKTVTLSDCGGPVPRLQRVTAAFRELAATLALHNLMPAEEPPLGAEADVSHVRWPKGVR